MCEKYSLELKRMDTGATVRGMAHDIQMLKDEISNMRKKEERKQQENMIANLVQWYYFEVIITEKVYDCRPRSAVLYTTR